MKWSKMECNGNTDNRRDLGGIKYAYACETSLYVDDGFEWDNDVTLADRIGVIERWKLSSSKYSGGSVYNAWVCYGKEYVDLGWFDFDPSCCSGDMNHCSSLKDLKAFVEDQHQLLNKGGG